MRYAFYDSLEYREKQSVISINGWKEGKLGSLCKKEERTCLQVACGRVFVVNPSDPKKFCSQSCAAMYNNVLRHHTEATRHKIANALRGRPNKHKGVIRVPPVRGRCENALCGKEIVFARWQPRKFCSNRCAMQVIGGKPTSPRAARAKAGVRADLGDIYFYSRWEANFARLLDFFSIRWVHQPKTFRLLRQNYTPDFYLPELDLFVEIKNFLAPYSYQRDQEFRLCYPDTQLLLLLKEEYLILQEQYAEKIRNWEYSV